MSYTRNEINYVNEDLKKWSNSRETSTEIATAISEMAEEAQNMQRLWEDPTPEEKETIISRAWALAGTETQLFWGCNTLHRG